MRWQIGTIVVAALLLAGCGNAGSSDGGGPMAAGAQTLSVDPPPVPVNMEATNLPPPPAPPLESLSIASQLYAPPDSGSAGPSDLPPYDSGAQLVQQVVGGNLMADPPIGAIGPGPVEAGPILQETQVLALGDAALVANPETTTLISSLLGLGAIVWAARCRLRV